MVTAARDVQSRAEFRDGIFGMHDFYPFKPLPDGSEIMPKVFLECPAAAPPGAARVATAGSRPATDPASRRPARQAAS
jgi:hypothetical protein